MGDGEMSKPSYVSYVNERSEHFHKITPKFDIRRLEGFGGSDVGPGVADLADYPGFAKQQVWHIAHFLTNT